MTAVQQRRRDLWAYLTENKGIPLRLTELVSALGYSSVGSTIAGDLTFLKNAGYITTDPRRARAIRVLIPLVEGVRVSASGY